MSIILLLLAVGLILVFLEFFLPGAVFATLGTISLLASAVLFFMDYSFQWGLLYCLGVMLLIFAICKCAIERLKRSKIKGDFYSGQDQEGYSASFFDSSLIGKEGIVSTELKPAGHIVIEGQMYQARSERGFISKGSIVKIVGGQGSYLIVRG
jgi:membrane-bound ClpP family serine protease